ncbi:MAG: bifunctional 4-hydroxy-3-methylbut-2-enyl diphosphate reductase/30S ribosomal protein S1 [Oscillospiraceae bacterium]|nr:bifunctional 4-hydroxy-3-methylbut-2-enyl diphosphate reductase/30S ribosomal protein S1 [Oscillospiraceae bacterium]
MTKIDIVTAENCGFCFGVKKAVEALTGEMAQCGQDSRAIYLIGKLIHNNSFMEEVTKKGVIVAGDDFLEFKEDSTAVIRAHGIPKPYYGRLGEISEQKNLKIVDATCECVKRMHKIAAENTGNGTFTLILGDKNHPEITALESYVNGRRRIVKDFAELVKGFDFTEVLNENFKKMIILAQTTHNKKDYDKCKIHIKQKCAGSPTEAVFFGTICDATEKRQAEAEFLSKKSDVMIVVGDQSSSNTKKLYEICEKNCANSFIVETSEQLPLNILKNLFGDLKRKMKIRGKDAVQVSITAGASTPDSIIMEVKKIMAENINNGENTENIENTESAESAKEIVDVATIEERGIGPAEESVEKTDRAGTEGEKAKKEINYDEMSFAELLDETFAPVNRGDRVKGIVSSVSDNEVHVDVGYKYTGVLTFSEITDDSSVDLKEMFRVGDEIETQIIKTNDQEGIALLSKKRIDSSDNWDKIMQFYESGAVAEGKVVQVVNGGVIVVIDSTKVFVPASHADVSKDTDLATLIGKKVKIKIIDINPAKHRAIASIRSASQEERKANEDKIWGELEKGKKYGGIVKSIANYGAFVDIGGVDGMIHLSELSWSRIKHPSEVVALGDSVEVYIKDFDREKRRIALGYKDESENPWTKFIESTKVGDVVNVKILNSMTFGSFAEIVPGVDGLIHISQISAKKVSKPSEAVNIGDVVQAKITSINIEAKQVALSIRALLEPEQAPEPEPEPETETSAPAETDAPPDEPEAKDAAQEEQTENKEDTAVKEPKKRTRTTKKEDKENPEE